MKPLIRAGALLLRGLALIGNLPVVVPLLWWRYGAGSVNLRGLRRVAVYPALGLAYNRIKKNANTSMVILLRELETGAIEDRDLAKWNSTRIYALPLRHILGLRGYSFFVVVRNPYSRVLSAFLDKFREEKYRRRHGDFPLTPEGFAAFLLWLRDGDGLRRDAHWNLQTRLMLLPLAKYDHVVRFENLRAGVPAMLAAHGLALPPGRLDDLYPSDAAKRTSSDAKLAQFYTPETAAIVREMFAADFAALGYDTAFPVAPGESPRA